MEQKKVSFYKDEAGNDIVFDGGIFNEEYCKWCYADGEYTYDKMDDLIDFCAEHMANEDFSVEQVRTYMKDILPKLNYWKC